VSIQQELAAFAAQAALDCGPNVIVPRHKLKTRNPMQGIARVSFFSRCGWLVIEYPTTAYWRAYHHRDHAPRSLASVVPLVPRSLLDDNVTRF
jgi:hypothetical protein